MDLTYPPGWVLAIAIVGARILDVSLGTIRTIILFRGHRWLAGGLGFLETAIWLVAAGSVIQNLDRWYLVLAWALGFGLGNVFGSWLEAKLALGHELVRIVSVNPDVDLTPALHEHGFGVVQMPGRRPDGEPVEVLLAVASRRRMRRLLDTVRGLDPHAFWTLSDVRGQPASVPAETPDRRRVGQFLRRAFTNRK
jgi:uncharacterized protein YebE (UPF0316 family)